MAAGLLESADHPARAECRARTRQSLSREAGRRDRDGLRRRSAAAIRRFSPRSRHVGNPVRPVVVEAAQTPYDPPREGGVLASPRLRRQPGRAHHVGYRAGRRSRASRPPSGRGSRSCSRCGKRISRACAPPMRRPASRPSSPPSSATCLSTWREASSSIARAGASTVAEISVIGRPSILVPLPGSLDQDQAGNAKSLADIGAATMLGAGAIRAGRACRDALANPLRAFASCRDGDARAPGRHSRRRRTPRRSRRADGAAAVDAGAQRVRLMEK